MVTIKVVILGVGHMGMPALLAITETKELLRKLDINVELAAIVDADENIKSGLEFFCRPIDPKPAIVILDKNKPDPICDILRKAGVKPDSDNVFIYDATPSHLHFINIHDASLIGEVTYLCEKPVLTEFFQLKVIEKLNFPIFCDFIETESLVAH